MGKIQVFLRAVSVLNDRAGKVVSLLILPCMIALGWEVIARYLLRAPTMWAHETSEMIFGAFFVLGGGYVLVHDAHVSVDMLYNRFPLRIRAIVSLLTWALFFLFAGVLLWEGLKGAMISVRGMETSESVWHPPIWPVKLTIPIGALLLLLQGLVKYTGYLFTAITGRVAE